MTQKRCRLRSIAILYPHITDELVVTYDAPKDIFPPASESTPFPDTAPLRPLSLLIHATKERGNKKDKDYSKTKLSTVVTADALEDFFTRYAEVCKSGMSGLKKRDRSKAKAKRSEERRVGKECPV